MNYARPWPCGRHIYPDVQLWLVASLEAQHISNETPQMVHLEPGLYPWYSIKTGDQSTRRSVISQNCSWFQDFLLQSRFASKLSWKKRSSLCRVQTSSFLFVGDMESLVNPPKSNIQEVQGALSSRPKGDPGPRPMLCFCQITQLWTSEYCT